MLRPSLLCVLLAVCATAHAEQKLLTESAFGTMSYDPASVHAANGQAQMQYRIDFTQPHKVKDGKSYSSATMKVAVDCRQQTVSLLEMQSHEGTHGQGAVVERLTPTPPTAEKVVSNSSNAFLYNAACGAAALPVGHGAPLPAAPAKK